MDMPFVAHLTGLSTSLLLRIVLWTAVVRPQRASPRRRTPPHRRTATLRCSVSFMSAVPPGRGGVEAAVRGTHGGVTAAMSSPPLSAVCVGTATAKREGDGSGDRSHCTRLSSGVSHEIARRPLSAQPPHTPGARNFNKNRVGLPASYYVTRPRSWRRGGQPTRERLASMCPEL